MRQKIDLDKVRRLPTAEDMFAAKYGNHGSESRDEFDARAVSWYYAECLRNARKAIGMTQQELADKIGKKREYIALLEKGETDMQLSTFIRIANAVGVMLSLTTK